MCGRETQDKRGNSFYMRGGKGDSQMALQRQDLWYNETHATGRDPSGGFLKRDDPKISSPTSKRSRYEGRKSHSILKRCSVTLPYS
jgi:hypothetical protein